MLAVLRVLLTLVLCVTFGALVGVSVVATRFRDFHSLGSMTERIRFATFSADSKYLFWVTRDEAVHVWDLMASREARCYRQHSSFVLELLGMTSPAIRGLAVSPDGKLAMSTTGSGLVRLWKLNHAPQP